MNKIDPNEITNIVNYVLFSKDDYGKYKYSAYSIENTELDGHKISHNILSRIRNGKSELDNLSLKNVLLLVNFYNQID